MEVADPVAVILERTADTVRQRTVGNDIEQDRSGIAHEPQRPAGNDERADQAHERVDPQPAIRTACEQAGDRQHRGQGISDDMQVGRAEIVILGADGAG